MCLLDSITLFAISSASENNRSESRPKFFPLNEFHVFCANAVPLRPAVIRSQESGERKCQDRLEFFDKIQIEVDVFAFPREIFSSVFVARKKSCHGLLDSAKEEKDLKADYVWQAACKLMYLRGA